MKRFCCLAILTMLSSSAYANSYSFVVAGHAIHIEASRHCRSTSCVSVSIPGIYETHGRRDRHDDATDAPVVAAVPVKPAEQAPATAAAPAASKPVTQPITAAPPPVAKPTAAIAPVPPAPPAAIQPSNAPLAIPPVKPRAPAPERVSVPVAPAISNPPAPPAVSSPPPSLVAKPVEAVAPSPAPAIQPSRTPPVTAPIQKPAEAARPPAKILKASDEESANTPLGDWRIEGKSRSVRIEQCGPGLCGYLLNASSNGKEEPVLINMKPHGAKAWSGDIYSRDSGNTFYGTIAMRGSNALRVEACALGRFFCSASVWSRIAAAPEITSSQTLSPPRT